MTSRPQPTTTEAARIIRSPPDPCPSAPMTTPVLPFAMKTLTPPRRQRTLKARLVKPQHFAALCPGKASPLHICRGLRARALVRAQICIPVR